MFLLVASALAGTLIGWPCQRLNWGWRNVWSTCSINSYAPIGGATEAAGQAPTGFRYQSTGSPYYQLNAGGVFVPNGFGAQQGVAIPALLCTAAANTGTGTSATLRNRCRRAIDAYGALVKSCNSQLASNRGPNTLLTPDWAPNAGHQPHVANVQGLTHNAQFCLLPAGANTPAQLGTPSNTCPGLLGWFTVVFNVCGFSNAPGMSPANQATPALATANTPVYLPATPNGVTISPLQVLGATQVVSPNTGGAGFFCSPSVAPNAANGPTSWNAGGPAFRTSRCRKALDQFGRTAARCHFSLAPATGPSQAGGYADPLRLLAVGAVPTNAPMSPFGMNVWAPACN